MLKVKYRENNNAQQGNIYKQTYNIINILPNGNNSIEERSFLRIILIKIEQINFYLYQKDKE